MSTAQSTQTLLLLFLLCFSSPKIHGQDFTDLCKSTSCSENGPEIIFPFRLNTQSPSCGLPEFELSCSGDHRALLRLPSPSATFLVKSIDYLRARVTISDSNATSCPIQTLVSLNLSASTFTLPAPSEAFAVVSCDERVSWEGTDGGIGPIDCLSGGGGFVYVVGAYGSIDKQPQGCYSSAHSEVKISTDLGLRKGVERLLRDKEIEIGWEYGNGCKVCVTMGGRCVGFNATTKSATCQQVVKSGVSGGSAITIGASVGGAGFVVVVVLFLSYRIQKSNKEKEIERKIEKFLDDYKNQSPIRYTYSWIKKITNKFEHKLGQGGHGSVYRGKLPNGVPVAVKMLKNSKDGNEFINEVATMTRIHHFNVVRLLGYCSQATRRALVYEYMPNESLHRLMASKEAQAVSWDKIEKIANGIAHGIEYLHQGCSQRILHFDIKPHNILLDNNLQPKISDFGMAMFCSKEESAVSMTNARGTEGYMAPELFSRNFGEVSCKCDVYSFGILLLEMVDRFLTVGGEREARVCFSEWIYDRISKGEGLGLSSEGDEEIAKRLGIVGLWCIQWDPQERPYMGMVIQMLEGDFNLLEMPPKPFVSSDIEMGVS